MDTSNILASRPDCNRDTAILIEHDEADPVVRFARLYRGRCDIQGTERGGCLQKKLNVGHYRGHFQGRFGLGIYPLMPDGTCAWAAVDIDTDDLDRALLLRRLLEDYGLHTIVLTSRKKGYHVTLFFAEWVRAADIRSILRRLVLEAGLPVTTEIFPKSDYPAEGSKAAGNYLRLPYLGARPEPGYRVKHKPLPGRRVALDPRPPFGTLSLEKFLVLAEASMIDPARVRKLAEEMRAEDSTVFPQIENGNGAGPHTPPDPRSGIGLPDDPTLLGVSPTMARLIRDGWGEGCGYRSRSEVQQAAVGALVSAGHDDATIRAVLTWPAYGISARALEQSERKREDAIGRCVKKARARIPNEAVSVGYNGYAAISVALHRRMLDLKLPPLAWPTMAEIMTTTDHATGRSLVSPSTIAKRLGCDPRTVYRYGIGPLREAGILRAVPLKRTGGRWGRVVHRVIPLSLLHSHPKLRAQSERGETQGECEIEK